MPTARIARAGVPRTGTSSHHQDQERTPKHLSPMKAAVERSHITRNTAKMIGVLLVLIGSVNLMFFGDDRKCISTNGQSCYFHFLELNLGEYFLHENCLGEIERFES